MGAVWAPASVPAGLLDQIRKRLQHVPGTGALGQASLEHGTGRLSRKDLAPGGGKKEVVARLGHRLRVNRQRQEGTPETQEDDCV